MAIIRPLLVSKEFITSPGKIRMLNWKKLKWECSDQNILPKTKQNQIK